MDQGCVALRHGVMKQPMSMQFNPSLKEDKDLQTARGMGSPANTVYNWEPFKGCSAWSPADPALLLLVECRSGAGFGQTTDALMQCAVLSEESSLLWQPLRESSVGCSTVAAISAQWCCPRDDSHIKATFRYKFSCWHTLCTSNSLTAWWACKIQVTTNLRYV